MAVQIQIRRDTAALWIANDPVLAEGEFAWETDTGTVLKLGDGAGAYTTLPNLLGGAGGDHTLLSNIGTNTHVQIDTHLSDATVHYTEASIDHTAILNIGTNTHTQIDTHIADATIHFTEGSISHLNITNIGTNSHAAIDSHIADGTIHFTEGSIDHTAITNIGTNTHAQIDTHIADATIHFTEASIDHTAISNIGTNTHAQIDTHIADATIHFTVASIDHTAILNIGTNSHAAIDTHIADATIHFTEASIDHTAISNIGTNSHAAIDSHIADATIHFTQGAISIPLSQISDVTATAAEVNLLDLAGLTAGWALIADSPTTASWQAIPVGATSLAGLTDVDLTGQATGDLLFNVDGTNWEDTAGAVTWISPVLEVNGADPLIRWRDTGAAANNTLWQWEADGVTLSLQAPLDDGTLPADAFRVIRSFASIVNIEIPVQVDFTSTGQIRMADDRSIFFGDGFDGGIGWNSANSEIRFESAASDPTWAFRNGAHVRWDGFGGGTAEFDHDATDFNTVFTATTDWNITGIAGFSVVNYNFDVDQAVGAGQDNFVLTYDDGTGLISLEASAGGVTDLQGAFDGGNEINSTTLGLGIPDMTEAQRDLIGAPTAGWLIFNTDTGQTNQYNGATWTVPGGGLTTLQGAYDNDPTGAQILLDATPNPFTVQASVAGQTFSVLDVGGNMTLDVNADPDTVTIEGQLQINDSFLNSALSNSLLISDTYTQTGAFIGGGILSNGTVSTAVSTTWIWALLQESKVYSIGINPAFAAFTLFNALPNIQNNGNFNLPQALVLNAGVIHRRTTSGTSTTAQTIGLSMASGLRTNVSGAVMTYSTGMTAVTLSPTWGTAAGSTVNFGTLRGLHCRVPAVGLFQSSAGVETMTAYVGVEVDAIGFGGNVTKRALRSGITAATNARMIDNTGGADSDFGDGGIHFHDSTALQFGGPTYDSEDVSMQWNNTFGWQWFWTANSSNLFWSNPVANQILANYSSNEMTFNTTVGFSLGAQTGTNGNQFGNFVAGAQTVTVGGEYSQFLLTQGGNVTADAALGLVAGWTINAPSITLGTGTVTAAGALNIGGNVNQGSVDRFGVRILSNPSGGSGVNAALWVTAGLTRLDGRTDINQPIALGGGAAPTLGTIGGSGPTTAAQAQWVEIDINGVAHWIPVWT